MDTGDGLSCSKCSNRLIYTPIPHKPTKKKKNKNEKEYKERRKDKKCLSKYRARGYKTFFMLNSVEHEILNADKLKNIKKVGFFYAQIRLECYFSRS